MPRRRRRRTDRYDDVVVVLERFPVGRVRLRAETLPPPVTAMQQDSLLMTPMEWKVLDGRVVSAGEPAIREIWRRLGLSFGENNREPYRIDVAAPLVA